MNVGLWQEQKCWEPDANKLIPTGQIQAVDCHQKYYYRMPRKKFVNSLQKKLGQSLD